LARGEITDMKKFTDKFIDNNIFVFDTFKHCIILTKKMDRYAPPERYFEMCARKDDLDIYIDTYWVNRQQKQIIDFAYHYRDSWGVNQHHWYELFYAHLEQHRLERRDYELKCRVYPRKRFKRLLEEYYE
jgi:hypothetical protein